MSTSDSLAALRRANPRNHSAFAEAVSATGDGIRARTPVDARAPEERKARGRLVLVAAAVVTLAFLAGVAASFRGAGSGVEDATAAVRKAASVTAASAELSGSAVVRIAHNGEVWAGSTIRWHGKDLAVSSDAPARGGRPGGLLLLVDGTMYGIEEGRWVNMGSPESIDPGSGTTPGEYLAATREDVGGVTLRRLTGGMTGLTTQRIAGGSTVYSGTVAAGLVARETGFKEGRSIRVLPFGYVAHDQAADPSAPLEAAVTVGADGVVREIAVSWGSGASKWTYSVRYNRLGATAAPIAPKNARPLRDFLRRGR
jgi:hypothetical protein